jgi:hypothetical protein
MIIVIGMAFARQCRFTMRSPGDRMSVESIVAEEAMSENKTCPMPGDARAFLATVENPRRQRDGLILLERFIEWTSMEPVLWGNGLAGNEGSAIIGFGRYHYRYESGREGDYFLTGFSVRKANMAIYVMTGFKKYQHELAALGPHKHSVSCLYLTNLMNNDLEALEGMVRGSVSEMQGKYQWWQR